MTSIEHVFVLMLENRSFDHLLGFSNLQGIDAETGGRTTTDGLTGRETNSYAGGVCSVGQKPPAQFQVDPAHEFQDVLEQLCGAGAVFHPDAPYPPIANSGFSSNFARTIAAKQTKESSPLTQNVCDTLQCFNPGSLPVLTGLAQEFAVCDSWFSSMPGPTWPNRFFALGGSSGGLDDSPTAGQIALWQTVTGFRFEHGTIFDRVPRWRIYGGNILFTMAHAIKGVHITDIHRYSKFEGDVNDPSYDAQLTWIEPNYGHALSDFLGGNSQHPLDGVSGGETLIKDTYEAIRRSPLWPKSLLIITWDEHGGFYDHAIPPPAVPPGDSPQEQNVNRHGFRFDQYGPRVPAVIISPLVPQNVIDHRVYDHASIPATVERLFQLAAMTARDSGATPVLSLASLDGPRDTPEAAPELRPADAERPARLDGLDDETPPAVRANDPIEGDPHLPGFLYLAHRTDLELSSQNTLVAALERRRNLDTRGQVRDYFEDVRRRLAATRR